MVRSITGPVVQRDKNWIYEPNSFWYDEKGHPNPFANEPVDDSLSNESDSIIDGPTKGSKANWSLVKRKKNKSGKSKNKDTPPFNIQELANLTDYAMVINKYEQPKWRQTLLKMYGPIGIDKRGYRDLSKIFLWEWNESELGRLYFDEDRSIFYDGNHFMVISKGHPDEEKVKCFSTNLETWLTESLRINSPEKLREKKWRYRNLWHELMRLTQVYPIHIYTSVGIKLILLTDDFLREFHNTRIEVDS